MGVTSDPSFPHLLALVTALLEAYALTWLSSTYGCYATLRFVNYLTLGVRGYEAYMMFTKTTQSIQREFMIRYCQYGIVFALMMLNVAGGSAWSLF